jgi:bacterioferritin (cytochrome b1)
MNEQDPKQGEKKSARRELLGSGALAAMGALVAGFAAACGDDDEPDTVPGPDGGVDSGLPRLDAGADAAPPVDAGTADADVATLNALLSAEYSAIAAYTAAAPLVTGVPNTDPLYGVREAVVAIATNIMKQHQLHAAALVESVTALGGTPVAQASVTFTPPKGLTDNVTITNILKFATGAERGAAVAYNKAVEKLEASKHRYLASAIEGDETQHFIILASLVLGLADPGPNLTVAKATELPPRAFVRTVGAQEGLDKYPPNYFASA